MTALCELAEKYGTDKGLYGHKYTPIYHELFIPYRGHPIKLLEIGVQHGCSIRMWHEYFPGATIVGVDNDNSGETEKIGGDVHFVRADQRDADAMIAIGEKYGPFNIILDDAGHVHDEQVACFHALFPRFLSPEGVYIIEDVSDSKTQRYFAAVAIRLGELLIMKRGL